MVFVNVNVYAKTNVDNVGLPVSQPEKLCGQMAFVRPCPSWGSRLSRGCRVRQRAHSPGGKPHPPHTQLSRGPRELEITPPPSVLPGPETLLSPSITLLCTAVQTPKSAASLCKGRQKPQGKEPENSRLPRCCNSTHA